MSKSGELHSKQISIRDSLYHSVLKPQMVTKMESVDVESAPEAVFRVRPITRSSASITGHGQPIVAASFSPLSSSRLATGSGDRTARIFDCDTGTPIHTLKGHPSNVTIVSWSPDGTMLATGDDRGEIRLWDPQTGNANGGPMKGHNKDLTSISWQPFHLQEEGQPRFASSSKDTTVRIWDAVSKHTLTVLSGHKNLLSCVRWGGTGRIYTSSRDRTIKIWDPNGQLITTLSTHAHWVNHLALSTEFVLRTAFNDHTRDVPSTYEGKVAKAKERFEKAATIDNKIVERLVSASEDNTLFLWEPSTSTKPLARLLGHQKSINHVTFSPDGYYIASSGWDNHVKLWNARDGKFLHTFRGHVAPVYMSSFSPDSRWLVSGGKDGTLKVWEVSKGTMKSDMTCKDEVYAVDWSPDGDKVGSGGKDKVVRIWRN